MKRRIFLRRTTGPRHSARLIAAAADGLHIEAGAQAECLRAYHDTFDWRLFRAGKVLEHDGCNDSTLRVRDLGSHGAYGERRLPRMVEVGKPIPAAGLPGDLRRLTGQRAALPRVLVRVHRREYRVIDREGKTRAFLFAEEISPQPAAARTVCHCWLRICTLRGYERTGKRLLDAFGQGGPATAHDDPFLEAAALAGITPGDYSLRPQLPAEPAAPAAPALAQVLLRLLDVIELNVAGVRADLDTEFLHDFRIACRRSRVLIGQVQGVFPAARMRYFRGAFAWLSRQTSAQRDLDVFLEQLPAYRDRLSSEHAAALQPLETLLVERRRQAHEDLRRALVSPRFRRFRRAWRTFLRRCAAAPSSAVNAARPVGYVANTALRRVYRRVRTQHGAVTSCSYSELLHELRKTGKKMRYVLEACAPLYAQKDADRLVRQLKRFQNDLGAMVDLHVQMDCINRWQAELEGMADTGPVTIRALDALKGKLADDEQIAQQCFASEFAGFAGKSTDRRVAKMTGGHA